MNGELDKIVAEAAAWHAASDTDDMDWDGLTLWLESDPRHSLVYDQMMLTGAVVDAHRDTLAPLIAIPANDAEPAPVAARRPSWLHWGGGAVAAALVATLLVPRLAEPDPAIYVTGTTMRSIALDDGSRIELAPKSRLEVSGRHQDRFALAGGAWFDIRHDPGRKIAITADGLTISDIGTRFDVQTAAGGVRVAVADGWVKVSGARLSRSIELGKGSSLQVDGRTHVARVRAVPGEQIGAWRSGRLSYDGAPLALVAADLSRYAGVKVVVADTVAARQFSGTLVIGDGQAALRDLSRLMGLRLDRRDDGYRLELPAR